MSSSKKLRKKTAASATDKASPQKLSATVGQKKSPTKGSSGQSGNGLRAFAIHALDQKAAPLFAKLSAERASHPAFSLAGPAGVSNLDPETVAKRYLAQALQSPALPTLTAPTASAGATEFKSLGTETVPLTGTRTVKFRQTLNQIPVYGSLVTVELDQANNLLSVNSSVAEPKDAPAVAKISPQRALEAVADSPRLRKQLANVVPHLNYYFDNGASKWRLVYILEDVAVTVGDKKADRTIQPATQYMDFIVDAQNGKVVARLPRTPSMAAVVEHATDGLGRAREITVERKGSARRLQNAALNIQTFDFAFGDPQTNEGKLPGKPIANPPNPWAPAAVSAHANAAMVAQFLRTVLQRNNIDNKGGAMNSSVNCVVVEESPDGRQWFNAFWNGSQMVYGQTAKGAGLMSLAVDLDVVGHEMFHGVTDYTARLEYANQSGALNESYSDIFGIIIANLPISDTRKWNWNVGEGLSPSGKPFRNMQDPTLFGQPAHMNNFKVLPNTQNGDWGGVHANSGIHNKAAYLILTAVDGAGKLLLDAKEVAAVFYLALTQQLSRTSQFSDSRRGALVSARSFFRTLPAAAQAAKLKAIENGFSKVGIQ